MQNWQHYNPMDAILRGVRHMGVMVHHIGVDNDELDNQHILRL
jgi:hypothetical protein